MNRREFITLLGGAAAWPLAARAQQPGKALIGYLALTSAGVDATLVAGFRRGLSQTGYIEGQNVAIEYRFAQSHFDRLPALAEELVRLKPSVIFAIGPPSVRALKGHTATIPVVFFMGEDPVKEGLVASLNRPGANITGFSGFTNLLFPKRLQLLNEVVPKPAALALLVNPDNPNAEPDSRDAQAAAGARVTRSDGKQRARNRRSFRGSCSPERRWVDGRRRRTFLGPERPNFCARDTGRNARDL